MMLTILIILGTCILIIFYVLKKNSYSNTPTSNNANTSNNNSKTLNIKAEIELESENGTYVIRQVIINEFKKDDDDWWYLLGKDVETCKTISTKGERCDFIKVDGKEYSDIPHLMKCLFYEEDILYSANNSDWNGNIQIDITTGFEETFPFELLNISFGPNDECVLYGKSLKTNRKRTLKSSYVKKISATSNTFESFAKFYNFLNPRKYRSFSFNYCDSKGELSNRSVAIVKIFRKNSLLYIRGLDSLSGEERTFNMDRMQNITDIDNSTLILNSDSLISSLVGH